MKHLLDLVRWIHEQPRGTPPGGLVCLAAAEQGLTEERVLSRARSNAGQLRVPHSWVQQKMEDARG